MNGYFAATKLSLQCNVVRAAKIGTVPCERLRRDENGSRVQYPISGIAAATLPAAAEQQNQPATFTFQM